jgi:hypothetical protein
MLKTQAEIARSKNVGRHAVSVYISTHDIPPAGKKGKLKTYDTSREPLASYVAEKLAKSKKSGRPPKKPAPTKRAEAAPKPPPPAPSADPAKITKPLNDLLKNKLLPGQKPSAPKRKDKEIKKYELPLNKILAAKIGNSGELSAAFYNEALGMARENKDAGLIFKLAAAADKEAKDNILREQMQLTEIAREKIAIDKAHSLRIKNELETGLYMKRGTVKTLFGRVYAVHTSVLQPLSLKLVSTLAAIPPGDDREAAMGEFIDIEIFSALESIQRILIEAVEKVE